MAAKAQELRESDHSVCDQNFPIEIIHLKPPEPTLTPLLLVGGMGPLAGLHGLENACLQFQDSREILLFQICHAPCRTKAVEESIASHKSLSFHKNILIHAIVEAITRGKHFFSEDTILIETIILCNTAHFFLDEIHSHLRWSPSLLSSIRLHCLVESAHASQKIPSKGVLVLSTRGARKSKIYENMLHKNQVDFYELSDKLQDQLVEIIYRGIKGFDPEYVTCQGEKLFLTIKKEYPDLKTIIAGCTEAPLIIDILKETPGSEVSEFLKTIDVIDPVEHALKKSHFALKKKYGNYTRLY